MDSDVLVQMFKCCVSDGTDLHHPHRRIDRSMIGSPTDFRHTAHIGASDLTSSTAGASDPGALAQMRSKGGYGDATSSLIENARSLDDLRKK